MNSGVIGNDFDAHLADENIDFATIHTYPDSWGFSASDWQEIGPSFMADRAAVAHRLGKVRSWRSG